MLDGLKGKSIATICNEYQISQSLYYQWRDQFLSNVDQVFDIPKKGKKEAMLEYENRQLKAMIGDLTVELKKKRRGVGVRRKPSLKVIERNESILEKIRALKADHPFWGYRRIWAHLTYVSGLEINKKRVYRLMKLHNLTVQKNTRLKAKRTPSRSKPQADKPNQIWGIDMTKFKTAEGWGYLVITLDWYSKKIVGFHLNSLSRTAEWLEALEEGIQQQFPDGAQGKHLKLISDNGCQPTSVRFMKACHHLGIDQIFTSYNNPKGNAETERMMRTLKEELLWLREWTSIKEAEIALNSWVKNYNERYLHSAHGYRSPNWAEKNYTKSVVAA